MQDAGLKIREKEKERRRAGFVRSQKEIYEVVHIGG